MRHTCKHYFISLCFIHYISLYIPSNSIISCLTLIMSSPLVGERKLALPQPIPENNERVYEDEYFLIPKRASPLVLQTKTKDTTKDIIKPKPKPHPYLNLKIISTSDLSMNVKNVLQNLEIK